MPKQKKMMDEMEPAAEPISDSGSYGYGKRSLTQWIIIYVIIGIVVYGLVYYFVIAPKGGSGYSSDKATSSPYDYGN